MEHYIESFIGYIKFEKRYSPHTIRSYGDDLAQFIHYQQTECGVSQIGEISSALVRSWLASLKEEGLTSRSIRRKISALKSFYKFHLKTGNVTQSPVSAIITPKASKRLPTFVNQEDMQDFADKVRFPDNWEGWTDRLIISLFYHTGIRLSELVNLKESHIDAGRGTIKVLGKGNKERIIPAGDALLREIGAYLARKAAELEAPERSCLLVGKSGKKLYPKYVYRTVRKYLGQIPTLEQRSPHVLRHTFATHLSDGGAELNAVKELLGHASLASTQVYVHNSIERLKNVHKNAHPKA